MNPESYPMTITPLVAVRAQRDRQGRRFLSFRATAATASESGERTVRVFGEANVARMAPRLRKGEPVSGRVAYESFTGADGQRAQTLRLVSIAA